MRVRFLSIHRRARNAELFIFLSVVIFGVSCIPRSYVAGLPSGSERITSSSWLADADRLLVVPCWERARHEFDSFEFGPFTVIRSQDSGQTGEFFQERRGWRIVDPFGHEGDSRPSFCGLVVIGSNGHIAKIDYRVRKPIGGDWEAVWTNPVIGSIGPKRKAGLLGVLEAAVAGGDFSGELMSLDVFGGRKGRFLGERESFDSARRFIEDIPALGDDRWRAADGL